MSLAQKIWYDIKKDIDTGSYQSEIERRVRNRPEFNAETTGTIEINFMMDCEKNSLLKEMFDAEYNDKAVQMFMDMLDAFNSSAHEETNKAFLEAMNRTHRHIQGEFIQNITKVFKAYSEQDANRFFDGRNLFAKEMCARMVAGAYNY